MSSNAPLPQIDYLARDFRSIRRLMLDRLAVLVPGFQVPHVADIGSVLIDLIAHEADQLSYQQDVVATETYLGTARQRISVRRHARLLDYPMHDGCNARTAVALQVLASANGRTLSKGTPLLTRIEGFGAETSTDRVDSAISNGAIVFETMHDIALQSAHNVFRLKAPLALGATSALLERRERVELEKIVKNTLCPGDLLLFIETSDHTTRIEADANQEHRQVVRLTGVARNDPTTDSGVSVETTTVTWEAADALAFPLFAGSSEVLGNVVLVDLGQTILDEGLAPVTAEGPYLPSLQRHPVTQQGNVLSPSGDLVPFNPAAPASGAFAIEARNARPAVVLKELFPDVQTWLPRRDLMASDRFAIDFVVEVDDSDVAHLRFGDDVHGKMPESGTVFSAKYRIGNGTIGNVGAETIAHVVVDDDLGILSVRNPLPARGGVAPESILQTQLNAPQALCVDLNEHAVTLADHAALAKRHPEVVSAIAVQRWNGSFNSFVIVVQRKGGAPVDARFRGEVLAFMEPYRLAGRDIEIASPVFVPIQIKLCVMVSRSHLASNVLLALKTELETGTLANGQRALFHPDNFGFGQTIYFSQVASAAMNIPGVQWVDVDASNTVFQRKDAPKKFEANAVIQLSGTELPRLENGSVEFVLQEGER